jgi:hypothetical protein
LPDFSRLCRRCLPCPLQHAKLASQQQQYQKSRSAMRQRAHRCLCSREQHFSCLGDVHRL